MNSLDHAVHACSASSRERLFRLFTSAPGAYWRHDVDVSLPAAQRMARFAQLAGVSSTFYLAARSDEYNLFSREGEDALWRILECGHRVGAHVDCTGRLPEVAVERDLRLLAEAFPNVFDDRLVSFHMPSPDVLWRDFPEFESAYAAEWEGRYLSDSRDEWGPAKADLVSDDMQINLHPEHWMRLP